MLATIDTPDLDLQLEAAKAELNARKPRPRVKAADADFARTQLRALARLAQGRRLRSGARGEESRLRERHRPAQCGQCPCECRPRQGRRADVAHHVQDASARRSTASSRNGVSIRAISSLPAARPARRPCSCLSSRTRSAFLPACRRMSPAGSAVGAPVRVKTGEASERVYDGKIARTAGAVDPHARTMRVEADLPNPDYTLAPGMYVRTEILHRPAAERRGAGKRAHLPQQASRRWLSSATMERFSFATFRSRASTRRRHRAFVGRA